MKVELNIRNTSKIVYPYIVARRGEDGSVWYWGQYKDRAEADKCAVEIGNGFVVEVAE
jgi:hypothetical protein